MSEEKLPHKSIYILPNLFTTGSIFLGFLAILFVQAEHFSAAAISILIGSFLDGLDGKVARLTNTTSEFGIQYDSLADLITFGMAPAFLMYTWALHTFGRIGIAISFLYLTAGALRLARFNISTAVISKKFFIGLPIPVAAGTLCFTVLFVRFLDVTFSISVPHLLASLILTLFLALLMISRIQYFSFKEFTVMKAKPFSVFVCALILFLLFVIKPVLFGFVCAMGYIISGLIYSLLYLPLRKKKERSTL
ncbi:MAG: CDP-diacylglycerol--serine O-phosphatidyltransferase [Desulfovibrionaceae bacterium]